MFYILTFTLSTLLYPSIYMGESLFSTVVSMPDEDQLFYTYLLDINGDIANQWEHINCVAHTPYLTEDSLLVRSARVTPPFFNAGGIGGLLQIIDWEGDINWQYQWADINKQQHHDIALMPNGNLLFISYQRKSQAEALEAGKYQQTGDVWSESVYEVQPLDGDSLTIVWEWHLWDHLIQDRDSTVNNYGSVIDHPELFDINYMLSESDEGPLPPGFTNPDIVHLNAIDYCDYLDLIVVSSRTTSEVYIIDHSTTTAEASSHTGGNYNYGGDILYRWGNPMVYNRGDVDDRKLFAPHGVNWLDGCNELLIFNNGFGRPEGNYSSVDQIALPLNENGFNIDNNQPFEPEILTWTYADESLFSNIQSGAYRLPNGNTFISYTIPRKIREIDINSNIVWEYDYVGDELLSRANKYNFRTGDFNNDDIKDVLDIILLVNFIINQSPYQSIFDINYDNEIDILDIISLVNIILN